MLVVWSFLLFANLLCYIVSFEIFDNVFKAGDGKADEYEIRILSELLDTNPNVKFSDIAG